MLEVGEMLLLRWNEFQTEAPDSRREMWEAREFTDVTLATADEQQILSHRLILSAHSSFFKRILMKNPQQNLVVYLKDICLPELELLLEFVYTGEVKVHREQLQTFLASGRELGSKGMEVSFGDHLEVDLGGGAHIGGKEEGIQVAQVGNGRTESDQQQIEVPKGNGFDKPKSTHRCHVQTKQAD